MEKYVHRTRFGRNTRFLKNSLQKFRIIAGFMPLFFLLTAPLSAAQSADNDEQLRFVLNTADSLIQTEIDYSFILEIPGVEPSIVEAFFEQPPTGTVFTGFEKKASHTQGTELIYSLRFFETGTIKLSPAKIRIKNRFYTAEFPSLTVSKNIHHLVPEFFFAGETSVKAGEPLRIYLLGRHFLHIKDMQWDIPENAVLEKVSAKNIPPADESRNDLQKTGMRPAYGSTAAEADGAKKVTEFLYTPFFEGRRRFPQVTVTAEAYNGNVYTIETEAFILNVLPAPSPAKTKSKQNSAVQTGHKDRYGEIEAASLQSAGFTADTDTEKTADTVLKNGDFARRIAYLRKKERSSLAFFRFRRERKKLEKEALLQNPDEASVFWTLAAAALLCILPVLIIVLLPVFKRSKKMLFAACVLECFLAVPVLKNIPKLTEQSLIAHKAILRVIPEIDAHGSTALAEGAYLRVLREYGEWYLAAAGERTGWILKDEAIRINGKEDK